MPETPTRRQKLRAMADQNASPEEAEIAKAMLARTANTPEERLEVIADDIKAEWGKGIESQFAIGRLLGDARAMFPADQEFGRWLKGQQFPFSYQTAWNLRIGAEREAEVRNYIALNAGGEQSRDIGVTTAVKELTAKPKPAPVADGSDDDDAGELIPVADATPPDPAYAALRAARFAVLGTDDEPRNAFESMHVDDLARSAGYIKDLAVAYNAAKAARAGGGGA